MKHYLSPFEPDLWVAYSCMFLFGIACVIAILFHSVRKKDKPELSSTTVDNVETIAFGIACQIRRCKTPEDFNKAIQAIGRYEWEFQENDNAQREAKILKDILDARASAVYGVETIVS